MNCARSASSRSTTTACWPAMATWRVCPACAPRPWPTRGAIRRFAASWRCGAVTAASSCLPLLDPRWLLADPKVFVGYSDLTALLAWQVSHGQVAFHGPMAEGRLARGHAGYDRASFMAAVTQPVAMGTLSPAGLDVLRPGEAAGVLTGGTITQLASLLGTPFACHSARAHDSLSRRRGRTPLSSRPPTDAAPPGGHVPARHRRGARHVPGL